MKPRVHRVLKRSRGLVIVPRLKKETFDLYLKTGELHSQTIYLTSVNDVWIYEED